MKVSFNSDNADKILKLTNEAITVTTEEDGVSLIGMNNTSKVEVWVGDSDVTETGATVIDKEVLKMINKHEKMTISDKEIQVGRRKINFTPVEAKALEPVAFGENEFSISADDFKEIVNMKYAIPNDDIRPVLNGVYVDEDYFVALTGFQLARRKHEKYEGLKSIILPEMLLDLYKKSGSKSKVTITSDNDYIYMDTDEVFVATPIIAGEYIKYESLISNDYKTKVKLNAKEFVRLLKSYKKVDLVKLHFEDDQLIITAKNDVMTITDSIEAEMEGEVIDIVFNIKYLISSLEQYEEPQLRLISPVSPMYIEEENKLDLVLPVRVVK